MSLVEELGVSLKDFLPQEGAHIIHHEGCPAALVSNRLYRRLKDYASSNQVPLAAVVAQPRRDVHEAA
jgi:hypothetical protein